MKFIHTADLHIDSKIEYLPLEKTKIMREEQIYVFEQMISYASVNGVKAIIIAGDMFDNGNITTRTKERILTDIAENPGIDFLYLSGNHDESLIFNQTDLPENLKFFGDVWTDFEYGNTVITGVKLSKRNSSFVYDTLSLQKDRVNIVAMHGQIVGYKNNEDAEIISLPKLKNKNIDYLALGHIHSYVKEDLDLRGKYCYSGCLKGRGFDEIGDKGFVEIDVEENKLTSKFVKLGSRNFYEHNFDISSYRNFYLATSDIAKQLEENYPSSSLIKLALTGAHKEDFVIDTLALSQKLQDKFFFIKVVDKTTLSVDDIDYLNDKSLKGEFIRKVMESDLTEEEKGKIILAGLRALKGEEV